MAKIDAVYEIMRESGMRVTQARKQLIEAFMNSSKAMSLDDIYQLLSDSSYDQVTLYRNLEAFDKLGILHRIQNEEGRDLFLLNPEKKHYHVILCRQCHRTDEIKSCTVHQLEAFAESKGFQNISHVLELYGTCEECSA